MVLRFFLIDAPDIQARNEADRIFELYELPMSLGRGANNSISLTDPTRTVSRNHARIFERDGEVVIVDLESKNFTYLNDERVNPKTMYPLKEGDVIQCGDFTLRIDVLDISMNNVPVKGNHVKKTSHTQIMFEGYEGNPFDAVVLELIETLDQLNTIYNQIAPALRDAMMADSVNRTIESLEESNEVMQLIADSISKTGLIQRDLILPKPKG